LLRHNVAFRREFRIGSWTAVQGTDVGGRFCVGSPPESGRVRCRGSCRLRLDGRIEARRAGHNLSGRDQPKRPRHSGKL